MVPWNYDSKLLPNSELDNRTCLFTENKEHARIRLNHLSILDFRVSSVYFFLHITLNLLGQIST